MSAALWKDSPRSVLNPNWPNVWWSQHQLTTPLIHAVVIEYSPEHARQKQWANRLFILVSDCDDKQVERKWINTTLAAAKRWAVRAMQRHLTKALESIAA